MDNIDTDIEDNYRSDKNQGTGMGRFSGRGPDEVKELVKEKVRKGVAAVAGAVEGFAQEMKDDDVAGNSEAAIEEIGKTSEKLVGATRHVVDKTRQAARGSSSSSGDLAASGLAEGEGSGKTGYGDI